MYYYNILPTKNIGNTLSVLTYSSQKPLDIGDIVQIEIRSSIDFGLIISQNTDYNQDITNTEANETPNLDIAKIKEITAKMPVSLSRQQMQFLKIFSDNTLNSLNDVWDSIWRPFELLTKKQWNILNSNNDLEKSPKNPALTQIIDNPTGKIAFELESDYLVRIRYIIRSITDNSNNAKKTFDNRQNRQVLIVFPERKLLDKITTQLEQELQNEIRNQTINLFCYTGSVDKESKKAIWQMVQNSNNSNNNLDQNPKIQKNSYPQNSNPQIDIILSTRSGIFLPLSNLSQTILVDEANSMFIQDQNSIYYDTREAVFLLNKAFGGNLTFISRLPSIRLYNYYSKEVINNNLTLYSTNTQKPLKIQITSYDAKTAKFNLFSWEVEQLFRSDEELINQSNS